MPKRKICRVEARPTYVVVLRSESGGLGDVTYSRVYDRPSPTALFLLSRACNALALSGDGVLTAPMFRPEAVGWVWARRGSPLLSETMRSVMSSYKQGLAVR